MENDVYIMFLYIHRFNFFLGDKMSTGIVKWFNPVKGYGFLQPEDGGSDIFVHISAVEQAGLTSLSEGQRVSYEVATNRGKTSAVNLGIVN